MAEGENIIKIDIDEEMRSAYIDYSMSVIVSRALPDVRDGLKPVHRRVLYGMQDLGVYSNRPHKKSARIVGDVLGKYHPHGDSSVYDTMVRMAQPWSLRYPMVDGQGNFGSVDGDSPAAMRYTESRLQKIAEELLADLDKETVDFALNFDDSLTEPTVLPTKIPNLLCNGASGIAVGMATNMPPHNLRECVDGITAYIDNRDIDIEGLMEYIKAPDFPTGGIIYGYEGVKDAFNTGRGRVIMRAKAVIEEIREGREAIIVTEIPYQVNKAEMIKKTADLVNDGKISGISDLRDESDRNGMRVVYELKRDAIPNVVLNKLFKYTALQTSFSVNNIALVKGRPEVLNLKDMIVHFVDHRHEVVVRRTQFELRKAEERAHILEGLIIASDNIDEVIKLIRGSKSPEEAREKLMTRFELSDIQSRAIVEMRLRQLTGLEQDKLRTEYDALMITIADLKDILSNEDRRMQIIKDELQYVRDKYGDERRSIIEYSANEMSIEDLIPNTEVVITISHADKSIQGGEVFEQIKALASSDYKDAGPAAFYSDPEITGFGFGQVSAWESLESIINGANENLDSLVTVLGADSTSFYSIIESLEIGHEWYTTEQNGDVKSPIIRERFMAEEFERVYRQDMESKYYGQFGRCHLHKDQDPGRCYDYYMNSIANRINDIHPSLKNQVLVIPIFYGGLRDFDRDVINSLDLEERFTNTNESFIIDLAYKNGDHSIVGFYNRLPFVIICNGSKDEVDYYSYDWDSNLEEFHLGVAYGSTFFNKMSKLNNVLDNEGFGTFNTQMRTYVAHFDYFRPGESGLSYTYTYYPEISNGDKFDFRGYKIGMGSGYPVGGRFVLAVFGLNMAYGQMKLVETQESTAPPNIIQIDDLNQTVYKNDIFTLDPNLQLRLTLPLISLNAQVGYALDISGKYWKLDGKAKNFTKTSFSAPYFQVGVSLNLKTY